MENYIYKYKPDVVLEDLGDGTGVFYIPRTNELLTLNSTAFFIAKSIDGKSSLRDIQKVFYDILDKNDLELSEEQINAVCMNTLDCFVEYGACEKGEL